MPAWLFPITAGVSSFSSHPSAMLMLSAVLTYCSLRCVRLTRDLAPHEIPDLSSLWVCTMGYHCRPNSSIGKMRCECVLHVEFFHWRHVPIGWAEIWLDWLKDEIGLTEGDEAEREKIYELFEKAVKDYICKRGPVSTKKTAGWTALWRAQ